MTDEIDEERQQAIAHLAKEETTFIIAAIGSIYWMLQSLRWGTAETTCGFMELTGRFGAYACACNLIRKTVQELSEATTNDR